MFQEKNPSISKYYNINKQTKQFSKVKKNREPSSVTHPKVITKLGYNKNLEQRILNKRVQPWHHFRVRTGLIRNVENSPLNQYIKQLARPKAT